MILNSVIITTKKMYSYQTTSTITQLRLDQRHQPNVPVQKDLYGYIQWGLFCFPFPFPFFLIFFFFQQGCIKLVKMTPKIILRKISILNKCCSLSVSHYELCRDGIGYLIWKPQSSLTLREKSLISDSPAQFN